MKDSSVKNPEVFSGAADPAEARVYAVANHDAGHGDNGWQLSGHLVGPQCEFAHTLPARISFRAQHLENGILAEAVVPDPCFWTPELPFLYRAELNFHHGDAVESKYTQTIGIRRFGNRGGTLYFDAKRFVFRGVNLSFDVEPTESQLNYARETGTATVVSWPTQQLCELASRRGMMVIADLQTSEMRSQQNAAETLRNIAHWPAVLAAIVDAKTTSLIESRGAVQNVLIGQYVNAHNPPEAVSKATQIIFAEVTNSKDFAAWATTLDRPLIAVRRLDEPVKIEEQRAACDALQRDLAPYGDFAGYIV
jgi:hypothetical protein